MNEPAGKEQIDKRFAAFFIDACEFTLEEFEYFLSHFTRIPVKKGEYFGREGDISAGKAYINKGCTRTYVTDETGNERILYFSFEDFWVCDHESFNTGLPGKHNVEMLEDCELFFISKSDWKKMEKEIPGMQNWYKIKVVKSAGAMLNRLAEEKTATPEERYLNLLKTKPYIFQRVPLKFIAAFLNIQPQSLSRMRKRILK